MYVERYGQGPQRVLGLHGWSGDHRTFAPLLRCLPPEVSLFAPDLPGCGRSPAPKEWRLAAVADEIAELMEELAGPALTLLGNCSGGLLGLSAIKRLQQSGRPPDWERIVLIDPLAYWPWYFSVFASETIGRYAYACSFQNPIGRWLVNASLSRQRKRDTDLTEGFDSIPARVTLAYLRILREIPGPEAFSGIQAPITIVHGAKTFASVRKSAAVYQRLWPQAEIEELTGAGHLPLTETPEAVVQVLLRRQECRSV